MTPKEMARIHALAFSTERPWSAAEFSDLLASKFTQAVSLPGGFALFRVIADEGELVTIAVSPTSQRQGIASSLMDQWITKARAAGAEVVFLEVAADNAPACALYAKHQFAEMARRSSYYMRKDRPAVDAIVLRRKLTLG